MFGIQYLKAGPTQYVIHYHNGKIRRTGAGLAFFYYKPASSMVVVPVGSADVPFIFNELSADYQPLTIQGQLTYRIQKPELLAGLLDYRVDGGLDAYLSDDPEKLNQRLVNIVQVLTRAEVQRLPLRGALQATDAVCSAVMGAVHELPALEALGVQVLDVVIQSIRPTPEMARALEAEAREALLRKSDLAIYDRRNAAVEQERRIKENELNTEIAVEQKKRRIRETKVEADLAVEAREQQVREAKQAGQIRLEIERKQWIEAHVQNTRAEADAQAYAIAASLKPLQDLDPATLEMLSLQSGEPRKLVALALREIAGNAARIGSLNISPDLLESLLSNQ